MSKKNKGGGARGSKIADTYDKKETVLPQKKLAK